MKILMLLQSEFPPDIRVEREIKSLSQKGFDVSIICNQYKKNYAPSFNYGKIYRISALFKNVKLNKLINFPLFINPRYLFTTLYISIKVKPDVVHAHDLPMMPLAILLKKLFNIKIVFDMHESYPEALIFFEKKGIINFIFKNPKLAKILENYSLKKADKIIVVVDEHKHKLIERGINEKKIHVVSNTLDVESFQKFTPTISVPTEIINNFTFTYSGKVSPDRALDVPIKALKYLVKKIKGIKFVIIGEGPNIPQLKNLAQKLKVEQSVIFLNWPGHNNIPILLENSNICIIPQPSNDFINSGIPNKLFEYMYMKKNILVSDAKPMSRIVREVNCGKVFKSNDPEDFASQIINIYNSHENFGENGKRAVLNKYNWDEDSKSLLKLYSSI